jgi:cytochrome P450
MREQASGNEKDCVPLSSLRTLDDLAGPDGLPLLGNAHQLPTDRLHEVLEGWARQHGTMYAIRMGPRRALVTSDAAACQQALRDRPDKFSRLSTMEPAAIELGMNGLFSSEGERWRRLRRIWIAALNAAQIKPFFPLLTEVTERLRQRWLRAAAAGDAVDVQADLMRYTVDVTMRFSLGHDANTLEQDGDTIQNHLHPVMAALGRRARSPFPYWRYVKLPVDRKLDRTLVQLRRSVGALIEKARARIAADPALAQHPRNLLEALLVTRDEDGSTLTDEDIFGNTMTVLLAGEDTTANTLAWMMHLLSLDPGAQQKMRAEVDALVGDATLWTDLKQGESMRYVEAVMSEALRLRPVAPFFLLTALQDVQVGDVAVPKGTVVILLTREVSAAHFEQPDLFRPERWLDLPMHAYAQKPPMPFGAFARVCPGRNLAVTEIKSVAAMLARNFDLAPAEGPGPVQERLVFTLQPLNLRVRLTPRAT